VTRYTGGAHCCTGNWIITKAKSAASWTMVDAGTIDGGGGYSYEDLDGDGFLEAIGVDNSFLYAFDSYAGSMAPQRIYKLQGATFKDVTMDPAFKSQAKQDLALIEFATKLEGDAWHTNGFLAGWVAKKIQLGEGDEAWARMLKNYQKNSDFGPQICLTGAKIEDCPAEQLKSVPFPKGLAQFLSDKDYGPLPEVAKKELN
jgi:serine protease Do